MVVQTASLGFPRIGASRELKRALEQAWSQKASWKHLEDVATSLRQRHWQLARDAGIDHIPVNDFSLYDQVLDMAQLVGAIPERFLQLDSDLVRYFAMARGYQDHQAGIDLSALEMTKWFNTNYHYIVPELATEQPFTLNASHLGRHIAQAQAIGIRPRAVVIGPVSFLLLSKMRPEDKSGKHLIELLPKLLDVYCKLLEQLYAWEIEWVQLDEPFLVTDLDERAKDAYRQALRTLADVKSRPKLLLTTYFGGLADNTKLVGSLPFDGIHLDLVSDPEQLPTMLSQLGEQTTLSLGVVDGRNIWRTDLDAAADLVKIAVSSLGAERVVVAPSCSLLHVPVDLRLEEGLDPQVKNWLAFAVQKLDEVAAIAQLATGDAPGHQLIKDNRQALAERASSPLTLNPAVRERLAAIDPKSLRRRPFSERATAQAKRFELPPYPTTTIGSFPQTDKVRAARASWRVGKISDRQYESFLREQTIDCLRRQERLGVDVLVHGEFERTDMVEYFGQKLDGFAFSQNGWVQSYGSRCVKPPILYGDVSRPHPMTVEWTTFAQAQTNRPVKGMLTGPVTILQWSFVRNDQPRELTCQQIGLALRDEVSDLEGAGIGMIQVDEPAIREGLPLRRCKHREYLEWAVACFRLATSDVADSTQIHTHMCYSEFGDMLEAIAAMDADVLSIESSRSQMELLTDFATFRYPNGIGPGVYDIHSPRVPTTGEMATRLEQARQVLPATQIWVNPDCGLKTRDWPEVEPALESMVAAAKRLRSSSPVPF